MAGYPGVVKADGRLQEVTGGIPSSSTYSYSRSEHCKGKGYCNRGYQCAV